MSDAMKRVAEAIMNGRFGEAKVFQPLLDTLMSDYYLLSHDFPLYLQAQKQVDMVFRNEKEWAARSILSAASMGRFSSDRSIKEYAQEIWDLQPCPLHYE